LGVIISVQNLVYYTRLELYKIGIYPFSLPNGFK